MCVVNLYISEDIPSALHLRILISVLPLRRGSSSVRHVLRNSSMGTSDFSGYSMSFPDPVMHYSRVLLSWYLGTRPDLKKKLFLKSLEIKNRP